MIRIVCFVIIVQLFSLESFSQSIRSIDGSFNNIFNPDWGAQGDQLRRISDVSFSDGISAPSGLDRPNPRVISNILFAQDESTFDVKNLSDFVWVFGQFIDHDITFVTDNPTESLSIVIPEDDKVFDPKGSPISMFRSLAMRGTGSSASNPRQYANQVTAFLDGSAIYGSTSSRANWLRTFKDGKLKTSQGNNLPWNTMTGEFNSPIDKNAPHMDDPMGLSEKRFVAGDARANENPLLIAMHTLFVREHNRMCDVLRQQYPTASDEQLYQRARKWTGAFLQSITYNEWLPAMGITLTQSVEYRDNVNPQISNEFSAAAFRVGHTLINSNLIRLESSDPDQPSGSVSLRDAFFNPALVSLSGGVEPFLRGMATQVQQKMDCHVIDDVRNFLFGSPQQGGLDLAAININRGRERGLPDYNSLRSHIGLPRLKEFEEISKHPEVVEDLRRVYGSIDNIDPWVGMLAEDYMPDAILGSTLMLIIEKQFQALRDGDRFFYTFDRYFTPEQVEEIHSTTMHDIVMRNTSIDFMQKNVFEAMPLERLVEGPVLDKISLEAVAYPNPTSGPVRIKVYADTEFDLAVRVYDLKGRQLMNKSQSLSTGDNFIDINVGDALSGSFYNVVLEKDPLNYRVLRIIKN